MEIKFAEISDAPIIHGTDHIGYYEKYGFTYIGEGYHPWGSNSRIYESNKQNNHFSI